MTENKKIILTETEYGVLLGNTISNFVTNRQASSSAVRVIKTVFIPSYDEETLEVRATTSTKDNKYRTSMLFDDVEWLDEPSIKSVTIVGSDSREYYLNRIPLNRIDVKVKCTCLDFYYRFAVWNHSDDSLIGNPPPPYVKKTNRQPVNPNKVPGVCKHVIKLASNLINQQLFK